MIDAVLSYHMNPATCGVAKFNRMLAKRLGVPCDRHGRHREYSHPLISLKLSEMKVDDSVCLFSQVAQRGLRTFDVFLHDTHDHTTAWLQRPRRVYAADAAIAAEVRERRPDVISAFCPSTVEGNPTRGAYRVLAFGMAHKLALRHFENLKRELNRDHPDYTIELSTAVHEGNPWDQALTESTEAMRGIFGERLRVLGFLADDALARVLSEVDAVAAFYVPALRANNTTAWAALSAGKFLYTNLDEHSPELNPHKYSWDALLKVLA
jgi:hypothetical protein